MNSLSKDRTKTELRNISAFFYQSLLHKDRKNSLGNLENSEL